MKSYCTFALTLLNLIAFTSLNAQDCPPINYMKDGSCIIVEYTSHEEASEAATAPAETLVVSDSQGNDGVYIAQMMADDDTKVVFSQAGNCGMSNYEGAVQGTFQFTQSGLTCTYGASGSVLPVEFTHFDAEKRNNHIQLTWGTSNEVENDGFSIERSNDGKKFEEMGFIVGEGYSTSQINYAFTDRAPQSGKNYYRLKQIDFNGNLTYSKIRVVELDSESRITINYDFGSEQVIFVTKKPMSKIEIFDMSGNRLLEVNDEFDAGENTLNVQNLVAGNYVLVATDNAGALSTNRFIKI